MLSNDGQLMKFLGKVSQLMWLNILTLVCCLPVITAGASLTAMHAMIKRIASDQEGYLTRSFFAEWKKSFQQATILWLVLLMAMAVLLLDGLVVLHFDLPYKLPMCCLLAFAGAVVLLSSAYVFPLVAGYINSNMQVLKNSFVLAFGALFRTIGIVLIGSMPLVALLISLRTVPWVVVFGFTLPGYLAYKLYRPLFEGCERQ